RRNRLVHLRLPRRIAVREEPLVVDDLDDRGRHTAADDRGARLVHEIRLAFRGQLLSDLLLGDLNAHARERTAVLVQDAAVEPALVHPGLRLFQRPAPPLLPGPWPS